MFWLTRINQYSYLAINQNLHLIFFCNMKKQYICYRYKHKKLIKTKEDCYSELSFLNFQGIHL